MKAVHHIIPCLADSCEQPSRRESVDKRYQNRSEAEDPRIARIPIVTRRGCEGLAVNSFEWDQLRPVKTFACKSNGSHLDVCLGNLSSERRCSRVL